MMIIVALESPVFLGLTLKQILAIVIPIAAVQIGLIIASFINLRRQTDADIRGGKTLWTIILVASFLSMPAGILGPVLYFTIARKTDGRD